MIIETANILDAEEILDLQKLCYISEAEIYSDETIPPLIQTIDEIKAEFQDYYFLKVVMEGKIIGSVRARISHPGTCYIGRLIVHPNFQNKGIGTRLMGEIEKVFHGCERWELITGHLSKKNIKLYEKLGYKIFKREEITPNLNLVHLEKINKIGKDNC
ncbi:GNAT family N-acetyltransferase [Methanobacterium formicicum]|uniref:GNAT family N-acetyltransferase n=1 Tax=Methanobacterium formicicum TaxID=2162 RepID=UPI002493003C|nr:GNAT family N-acetyltransferase [Methanobacterium formicicum]